MLGCESESKLPNRPSGKPGRGLLRDMSGVVVEDDFNCGVGRIGGVEELDKLDKFAAAVALFECQLEIRAPSVQCLIKLGNTR